MTDSLITLEEREINGLVDHIINTLDWNKLKDFVSQFEAREELKTLFKQSEPTGEDAIETMDDRINWVIHHFEGWLEHDKEVPNDSIQENLSELARGQNERLLEVLRTMQRNEGGPDNVRQFPRK